MQFVTPRYRRVMRFPITITVPIEIVIQTGLPRVISVKSETDPLPAVLVNWMAVSLRSPHRETFEPVDAGEDKPASTRTVTSAATVIEDGEVDSLAQETAESGLDGTETGLGEIAPDASADSNLGAPVNPAEAPKKVAPKRVAPKQATKNKVVKKG